MLIIQKDWKNKTCTINKFKFPALTQRLLPLQLPVGFFKLFWAQLTPRGVVIYTDETTGHLCFKPCFLLNNAS